VSAVIADKLDCGKAINNAPMHLVAKAGIRALDTWVRTGQAPVTAARMEVTEGEKPAIRRDADGIGLGGIRTPVMDVPVDVLTGTPPPNPDFICILMGSTEPLPEERIAGLYKNKADYEAKYRETADATVKAGFVLAEDRDALIGFSQPDRVAG
jgi:hypothetical protein